jgi:glucosamine--fructose-6-phosphate aminotransferase (isomerizing)
MCGIFGSLDFTTYNRLLVANQERGNFASGGLYVGDDEIYLRKDGSDYTTAGEHYRCNLFNYNIFLGHTQAPTGSQRKWAAHTTHPFEDGQWIVAHNGVLENYEQLREENLPGHTNPVDSSIIPALLDMKYVGDEIYCISEVMNMLKGTFACWIYSERSRDVYLVRSGSTLFYNPENCIFSSILVDDCMEPVKENVIYQLTKEGITRVGEFKADSPFFVL